MSAPQLRQGKNGKFTTASLRDYYRHQISHKDGMDRIWYAYGVLDALLRDNAKSWTAAQSRAVAEGLRLGMEEGVR